ncbi:MAG: hypothetical protein ACRDHK_13880, partial [Actinomycetota bacterium]
MKARTLVKRPVLSLAILTGFLVGAIAIAILPHRGSQGAHSLVASFGRLGLSFERNDGQTDDRAAFLARGSGYTVYLLDDSAWFTLQGRRLDVALEMAFVGANADPRIDGLGRL